MAVDVCYSRRPQVLALRFFWDYQTQAWPERATQEQGGPAAGTVQVYRTGYHSTAAGGGEPGQLWVLGEQGAGEPPGEESDDDSDDDHDDEHPGGQDQV